jgi:hypothetical protein
MKTSYFSVLAVVIVLGTSCKKNTLNPSGIGISKVISDGYLFGAWTVNDESDSKRSQTLNSNALNGKTDPQLEIKKDGTYSLKYKTISSGISVTESGTWKADETKNWIVFQCGSSNNTEKTVSNYTFQVNQSDEEELILSSITETTSKVTDGRGEVHDRPVENKELLYFEDGD